MPILRGVDSRGGERMPILRARATRGFAGPEQEILDPVEIAGLGKKMAATGIGVGQVRKGLINLESSPCNVIYTLSELGGQFSKVKRL